MGDFFGKQVSFFQLFSKNFCSLPHRFPAPGLGDVFSLACRSKVVAQYSGAVEFYGIVNVHTRKFVPLLSNAEKNGFCKPTFLKKRKVFSRMGK